MPVMFGFKVYFNSFYLINSCLFSVLGNRLCPKVKLSICLIAPGFTVEK